MVEFNLKKGTSSRSPDTVQCILTSSKLRELFNGKDVWFDCRTLSFRLSNILDVNKKKIHKCINGRFHIGLSRYDVEYLGTYDVEEENETFYLVKNGTC